ncbi:hypothetical protein [Brachybacterium subflavum]|uniref:hypothetical protein n=1 Tax=Brachybacterium subflavum TaxID=2585206 RepID=UPI0012666A3C|nr:hypothetical protein [Brachybacterium subflavum]
MTASWCLPCRPARTLLQELRRRWGERVLPLVLDADAAPTSSTGVNGSGGTAENARDTGDDPVVDEVVGRSEGDAGVPVLARLAVEQLPTWILLRPETRKGEPSPHVDVVPKAPDDAGVPGSGLAGESLEGQGLVLRGGWHEVARRVGAVPKLEILALADEPDVPERTAVSADALASDAGAAQRGGHRSGASGEDAELTADVSPTGTSESPHRRSHGN